ncbi:MAG: hypothetical protein GY796_36450 [Chloroflexi bacterium]|nr:hypothetical protein [Chloroflexota bacterium]
MNNTEYLELYDRASKNIEEIEMDIRCLLHQQRYWKAKRDQAAAELPAVVEAERVAGKVWDK